MNSGYFCRIALLKTIFEIDFSKSYTKKMVKGIINSINIYYLTQVYLENKKNHHPTLIQNIDKLEKIFLNDIYLFKIILIMRWFTDLARYNFFLSDNFSYINYGNEDACAINAYINNLNKNFFKDDIANKQNELWKILN